MKKILSLLIVAPFLIVSCSMLTGVKLDKKAICKSGCDSKYESCNEEAKKDTKALAACEAKKLACYKACDEAE